MARYLEEAQFPVCRPQLGLRQCGSCVEAINGANKPAREMDMAHWLGKMTNAIVERANLRKQHAHACVSPFPLEYMTACLHNTR